MNPVQHLNHLCGQLREAEARHRSTCNDYWIFVERAQRLRRSTYLLQFKILEHKKKILTRKQTKKECAGTAVNNELDNYEDPPKTEKQRNAIVSETDYGINPQRKHLKCFAHDEAEISSPHWGEEKSVARNIWDVNEDDSREVGKEAIQSNLLDEGPTDMSNETTGLQVIQEAGDSYVSHKDFMLTGFFETNGAQPELLENPPDTKILAENDHLLNTYISTLSSEEKNLEHFPLVEINHKLYEHSYSDRSFPSTSREVKSDCGKYENTESFPKSRTNSNEMKTFESSQLDECWNGSNTTELEDLNGCLIGTRTSLSQPEEKKYAENYDNSPRTWNVGGLDRKKSPSNNPVPLSLEVIVTHSPFTESDENLPCCTKNSYAKSSKISDDGSGEIPLKYDEPENRGEENFEDHRVKLLFSKDMSVHISKEKHRDLVTLSLQPSDLKGNVASHCLTKTENALQGFEPISTRSTSAEKLSLQGNSFIHSNNRNLFKCSSKSDTNTNYSSVTCGPFISRTYETKKSNSFRLFSLAKYNARNCDTVRTITPDYYYAVDDQQALLPSEKIFKKRRKFFHFGWKPFQNVKRRSKFARQRRGIFSSKSQEETKIRGKKASLFSRIFRPLINCGHRRVPGPLANDFLEVLDPLEELEE